MASSKRPRSKGTKRKSKARQTTLNSFTVPQSVLQPEIVRQSAIGRRSTRGAGSVVDTPNPSVPSLATLPAGAATLPVPRKTKKPKQQIIKSEKSSVISVIPAPASTAGIPPASIHPPKSPNFAVIIYTRSKKSSEQSSEHAQVTGSWFQPGVRLSLDQGYPDDVFPKIELPLDRGKGKEIAPQDTGNTTDEDTIPVLASAKNRRGDPITEAPSDIPNKHGVIVGIGKKTDKKPKPLVRTKSQVKDDDSGEVMASTIKRVRRSKSDQKPRVKYDRGGNGSVDGPAARRKSKGKGKLVEPEEIDSTKDDPVTPTARRNTRGKGKGVAPKETEATVLEHKEADGDEISDEDRQDDLAILSQKRSKF